MKLKIYDNIGREKYFMILLLYEKFLPEQKIKSFEKTQYNPKLIIKNEF